MKVLGCSIATLSFLLVLFCPPADTEEFTRVGSLTEGNKEGDLPAYEGLEGLKCPRNYEKGEFLPNPYKREKPLFRIDHTNVERFKHRLSPGQIARLKKNKKFYMNVYPTHRNVAMPEAFYAATEKNLKTCHLDDNNMLRGYNGGVPFPYPRTGVEAIWNIKKQWIGDDAITDDCRRLVSPSGKVRKDIWRTQLMAFDESRLFSKVPNPHGVHRKLQSQFLFPAEYHGVSYLTISYVEEGREDDTWTYMPSLRRVRRSPTLTGGAQLDGESTLDELGFDFKGPVNDWYWKLIGKKEMYIPYNCYDQWKLDVPDSSECMAGDINPKRLRYELHRVWVVEGVPWEGLALTHPYSKRVGYYDEDCWMPVAGDRYDRRGNLWRTSEYYTATDYCSKYRTAVGHLYLNLESGRYELFGGCRTKDTRMPRFNVGLQDKDFTIHEKKIEGR